MSQVTIITSTGKKVQMSALGASIFVKNNKGSYIEGQKEVEPIKKKEPVKAATPVKQEAGSEAKAEPKPETAVTEPVKEAVVTESKPKPKPRTRKKNN